MYIKEISRFSSVDNEADIYVTDGHYSLLCYSFPANMIDKGMTVSGVFAFQCSNIFISTEKDYGINKLPPYYAYQIKARVISTIENIVALGDIVIHLDSNLPGDTIIGDYVCFDVLRLDV